MFNSEKIQEALLVAEMFSVTYQREEMSVPALFFTHFFLSQISSFSLLSHLVAFSQRITSWRHIQAFWIQGEFPSSWTNMISSARETSAYYGRYNICLH